MFLGTDLCLKIKFTSADQKKLARYTDSECICCKGLNDVKGGFKDDI